MNNEQPFLPDPMLGDLLAYDRVAGLDLYNDPLAADPSFPELQQPAAPLDVQMQQRPGDMAADALTQMHQDLTYQQLDDVPYSQVFMDQHGTNDTRRRHFDLLMAGLDAREPQEL
ncbi:MAG TPA: hypothetical protein VHZ51_27455 [Ktedonobacteraceae bacterium]|nr:hypothetical protein [Ktedonobacteraceae bacterium]